MLAGKGEVAADPEAIAAAIPGGDGSTERQLKHFLEIDGG